MILLVKGIWRVFRHLATFRFLAQVAGTLGSLYYVVLNCTYVKVSCFLFFSEWISRQIFKNCMYNLCVSKAFLSSEITLSLNNQIRMFPSCVTIGLELGLGFMKCFQSAGHYKCCLIPKCCPGLYLLPDPCPSLQWWCCNQVASTGTRCSPHSSPQSFSSCNLSERYFGACMNVWIFTYL